MCVWGLGMDGWRNVAKKETLRESKSKNEVSRATEKTVTVALLTISYSRFLGKLTCILNLHVKLVLTSTTVCTVFKKVDYEQPANLSRTAKKGPTMTSPSLQQQPVLPGSHCWLALPHNLGTASLQSTFALHGNPFVESIQQHT